MNKIEILYQKINGGGALIKRIIPTDALDSVRDELSCSNYVILRTRDISHSITNTQYY